MFTIEVDDDGGIHGINRYIVGCKYGAKNAAPRQTLRINRYIVGCKSGCLLHACTGSTELIDT